MRFNAISNWDAVSIVAYTKLGIKRIQGLLSVHLLILDGALSSVSYPTPLLLHLLFENCCSLLLHFIRELRDTVIL